IRLDCASIFYPSEVRADVGERVSSVAGLGGNARGDVPAFLQCLTDLLLAEMFLFCPIFGHTFWLSVFRYELRRFHVIRVPIKIKNFLLRAQKIFRMAMTLQTPCHAMRLSYIYCRHVIHRTMATEATDAAVHMRTMVVKHVIDRAMKP